MNSKVYEKTRYQNIYRHKKNKNYVIIISKPVKTSIATVDGKKINKMEDAIKIRDNQKIKLQKGVEINCKGDFDTLWNKYMYCCEFELKQAFNTIHKKEKIYNKHLKGKFNKSISKINKQLIIKAIDEINTTDKQKNEIMKDLKAFFNWCVEEQILIVNPIWKLKNYKVPKPKMKYWIPEQFMTFIKCLNKDILSENSSLKDKEIAYRTKILTLLGFTLGDRFGETRALTFKAVNKEQSKISIRYSINYDTKSNDFLSSTKTYASQRDIDISTKLIKEIENYKYFLINELNYDIKDDTIILFNHKLKRPYSDSTLRNNFYKYCNKANVPKIRPYDLRHTYVATMMAEGKELYLISERLGHTNFNTTVNKYGHLSNEIRKEIAGTTDKYI